MRSLPDRKNNISPDESKLFSIHAGIQSKTGVFSKWRNNQAEHQGNTHKHRRKNNLENNTIKIYYIKHTLKLTDLRIIVSLLDETARKILHY